MDKKHRKYIAAGIAAAVVIGGVVATVQRIGSDDPPTVEEITEQVDQVVGVVGTVQAIQEETPEAVEEESDDRSSGVQPSGDADGDSGDRAGDSPVEGVEDAVQSGVLLAALQGLELGCSEENDLIVSGEIPEEIDLWSIGTWGQERGFGDSQTSILAIGEDSTTFEYTFYNYITSKPPFHYDITLQAFEEQVEGEPIILDKGTENEREASRGELFYPGDHDVDPVASREIYVLCDE